MRTSVLVVLTAFVVLSSCSHADVITGTIQGTIGGSFTNDYGGLFGPPGDLTGKAVTLRYSYDTNDFYFYGTNVHFGIGPGCAACSYYMSRTPTAADYTSITVNGITQTSTATRTATLVFRTATATSPAGFVENTGGDFGLLMQQNPGILIGADTSSDAVFGKPIPDASILPDLQLASLNGYGSAYQYITFTPNATAITPEPSTFALAGSGLLSAFYTLRKRRLKAVRGEYAER